MKNRLILLVESRIRGDVYVRFGGEHPKTHRRNTAGRWMLSLPSISKLFDIAMAENQHLGNKAPKPHALPERPLDKFCYEQGTFMDIRQAKLLNGWKVIDDWVPTAIKVGTRNGFVHVSMLEAQCVGASLSLNFTGRSIGIFCVAGPQAATLEYSIDGAPFKKIDTYTAWSKSLYLPWVYLFETELADKSHTLWLKIAEGERAECQIRNFVVGK